VTPFELALARYIERSGEAQDFLDAPLPIRVPKSRFTYELPTYVRLALAGSTHHAWMLLHCYQAHRSNPHMAAYMRAGRRRYSRDTDKDRAHAAGRALGLMPRKGRPTISAARKMTAVNVVHGRGKMGWEKSVRLAATLPFMLRIRERAVKDALGETKILKSLRSLEGFTD
jgi:hypothetical protein